MSERVKKLTPYVLTLRSLKPKQRKILLSYCSKDQIRALEEIALNIVKNNTPLSNTQLEVCKKWRKPLKMLALKRYPIKAKKEILQQGGFIGAILPVLATVLGSLIGNG
jgi:hypothetical protein